MPAPKRKSAAPQVQAVIRSTALVAHQYLTESGTKYRVGFPAYEDWEKVRWYHKPNLEESEHVKIAWNLIWCGGYKEENGERKFHHFERVPCACPPGPQVRALVVRAKEIALIGGRGSAKSETVLPFLSAGNPELPPENPYSVSYLNCPKYKFLVLRKNAKDLKDFFERAKQFFGVFGGRPTESPMEIHFPSGAWGVFDHVEDDKSYQKYQGQEFARIAWEELNQCPSESLFMKIRMSLRSPLPDLYEQMMLTFNPGGPGHRWTKARYLDLKDEDGKKIRSGQIYTEPLTGRTRVFIHSTVEDNPYTLSKGYDRDLEELRHAEPALYERWRFGNYDIIDGAYFETFREEVRRDASGKAVEAENACHVLKCTPEKPEPVKLANWWPRAIGLDWGYSHPTVATWGCWDQKTEQLHVYREFKISRMGTLELGTEIAKRSFRDLELLPSHHMMVHLSHDAFHRTDDALTEAEQIASGIARVLGSEAVFVFGLNQDEEKLPYDQAWASVRRRQKDLSRKTSLTLVRAGGPGKRKPGFQLIRNYLRWHQINSGAKFNEEFARHLLMDVGAMAYAEYKEQCERHQHEILPKLQIWDCCPEVIKGLLAAVEAESDPEDVEKQDGDDALDSLNYLCSGFPFQQAEEPRDIAIHNRMDALRQMYPHMDPTGAFITEKIVAANYDKEHQFGSGFSIPRGVGPTARRLARAQRVQ